LELHLGGLSRGAGVHLNGIQEVRGSTPLGSTSKINALLGNRTGPNNFERTQGFTGASVRLRYLRRPAFASYAD
jgi:hypothetical protein